MTIYEVVCPFCLVRHLIDSRKHMFKRYEDAEDTTAYVKCQSGRCARLFRVSNEELKEIKDLSTYLSGR